MSIITRIKSFAHKHGYTHVEPGPSGHITFFAVEHCDSCKRPIKAANSVNVRGALAEAMVAGLVQEMPSPPEGGYCDAQNAVVCPSCYTEENTP